jgi:YidC/Oxa1 family membrane protein insertase
MEKRVLLAVILSFIVLYGYQALFPPPRPEPPVQRAPQPVTPPPAVAPGGTAPAPNVEAAAPTAPAAPLVADSSEREIVVENDAVRATFSSRGAVLTSWRLKRYLGPDRLPLDLVPHNIPSSPRPFTLVTDDQSLSATIRNALYKPSAEALNVGAAPANLAFEFKDAGGVAVRKEFTFDPQHPYVIGFTATVMRGDTAVIPIVQWGPALGTGIVGGGMTYAPAPQPVFYRDQKVTRISIDEVPERRVQEGALGFAGVDDHYFLSAALPARQPLHVEYDPVLVPVDGADHGLQFVSWAVKYPATPLNERFFVGPKDFDVLASVNRDLVRAIDFGIFSWLVVPLLRALKWINGYVGNYGWSLILLTVIINLAMFPLRHKSVVSMRKMQELQPEVKAIQERYAKLKMSDPARQKMNVELMNLYRERGANPASGCVPMLLTMPVLFAFYAMLSVAIELRGAPFVGWIKDLSVYDPLFVTPVLMGITMVVQQRMTPTTADPVQQKMMTFMPIVFTAMFIWAPSGLVLYWTVSNLWAIGQQALTNRLIGPSVSHAVRPAAERRLKNAGAGKSEQASKERK